MSGLALSIRPARPNDRSYIVGNWVKEMRHAGASKHVPNELYWPAHHELADKLMRLGQAGIACKPDNEDHIYGCIVWHPARTAILAWLHVKSTFRRLSVARALRDYAFPTKPTVVLCLQAPNWTFSNETLCRALGLVHFPYPLMGITPAKELQSWPEKRESRETVDPL